jgi:hypothetical protein
MTNRFVFLLIGMLAAASVAVGQNRYHIEAQWDEQRQSISGVVFIEGVYQGLHPIVELPIQFWPGAYHSKSKLSRELVENQNVSLYFEPKNKPPQLQAFWENQSAEIKVFSDSASIVLPKHLENGDSIRLRMIFQYQLPNADFNGFGMGASELRLSNWFPRIPSTPGDHLKVIPNNFQRYNHHEPALFSMQFYHPMRSACFCSAPVSNNFTLDSTRMLAVDQHLSGDLVLICGPFVYQLQQEGQTLILTDQLPPPFNWYAAMQQVEQEVNRFLGIGNSTGLQVAMLESSGKLEPHPALVYMNYEIDSVAFAIKLAGQLVRAKLLHERGISEWEFPMLTTGLGQYFEHRFATDFYPEYKFLGPIANKWYARFLDLDSYSYDTETLLYYWYLTRVGVDPPLIDGADRLSKGSFLGVTRGKAALAFSYLEDFAGRRNFDRGMQKWMNDESVATPAGLEQAVRYFHNRETSWWTEALLPSSGPHDYAITKIERCPTTFGFRIKNRGQLATPFSVTGIKDGKPLITIWYEGFEGSKRLQFHQEDYEALVIDYNRRTPEVNFKNNFRKTEGLFRGIRSLQFKLLGSIEHPEKHQVFWMPHLDFNAYDQVLLGISFYNTTPIPKRFEYAVIPEYSTGTGKLMGTGGLLYRIIPASGPFHQVYFSLYGRYNHYAENLSFTRISPTIGAYLRKPNPRDENIHKFRLRLVSMQRESPNLIQDTPENEAFDLNRASYDVGNFNYHWEYVNILRPHTIDVDLQHAALFTRLSASMDKRWMLPNKKWAIFRVFAGAFLQNDANQTTFYSMGLSGTRDYLFDYSLIGRTDLTGLWSRQFFVTDGGFRSETGIFSQNWMTTAGISMPVWKVFGLYGDLGFVDRPDVLWWGYGIRVAILSDFLEFYLPIQSNQRIFISERGYFNNVRFVLNIRYDQIVQRLRRGYY